MSLTLRFERVVNTIVAVAVVLAVGVLVRREFFPAPERQQQGTEIRLVKDWGKISDSAAVSIDSWEKEAMLKGAYVVQNGARRPLRTLDITVFTDFQCPACRVSDSAMTVLANKYIVQRKIVHLPLGQGHTQAMLAAKAFECADSEGQGPEMHQVLFENQANLGVKPWTEIAAEADVEDTTAFRRCLTSVSDARIKAGIELAKTLGVNATPTAVINGWLVKPAFPDRIDAVVEAIVRNQKPR
jgi:protein-disulfide isomerase